MSQSRITCERALTVQSSVDPTGARQLRHPDFLRALFKSLDALGISYCVLPPKNAKVGDFQSSTTRLALSTRDETRLSSVFRLLHQDGYWLLQHTQDSAERHLFSFLWLRADAVECAALDFCFGQFAGGRKVLSAEALLEDRQRQGAVWAVSPAREFTWLLAAAAATGGISDFEVQRLQALTQQLYREVADHAAERLFGLSWSRKVIEACANTHIQDLLPDLRRRLWLISLKRHPLQVMGCLSRKLFRSAKRCWQPSGALVVLLGPDGAGKTTVANFLSQTLKPLFAMQRVYHWRPGVLGGNKSEEAVTEPHRFPPRGRIASVVYLLLFFLDNILGFVFQIWPVLVRRGLVIFDRSFSDVLVDSRRYRYGGPHWAAHLLERLVPPREKLVLILDASETSILSRKGELSFDEVCRQRDGYRRLVHNNSRMTRLVLTDQGLDAAQRQVLATAIDYLVRRFSKQHGVCLTCSTVPLAADASR